MALALWVLSLLGSACRVSANIFGEFPAEGHAVGEEGALRPELQSQPGSNPGPLSIYELIYSLQCPQVGYLLFPFQMKRQRVLRGGLSCLRSQS